MRANTRPLGLIVTLAVVVFTFIAIGGVRGERVAEDEDNPADDVLTELAALNSAMPTSGDGEPAQYDAETVEYIGQLWEDMENAFQYLEQTHLEDLRRLALQEVGKRLPLTQHNFVRFGKRQFPTHNFVRIGRSSDLERRERGEEGNNEVGRRELGEEGNDDDQVRDWFHAVLRRGRSADEDRDAELSAKKRFYHRFVRFGRTSSDLQDGQVDGSGGLKSFDRVGRSAADLTADYESEKRNGHSFVRFGRSPEQIDFAADPPVPLKPIDEDNSVSKRSNKLAPLGIRLLLNQKRFATARIGRLPAMLFYHNRRSLGRQRQMPSTLLPFTIKPVSSRPNSNRNSYPRYG